MPVSKLPAGYHSITPYLIVRGGAQALAFYKEAFGAREIMRMPDPTGTKIGHAEVRIGDSVVMLADECPERNIRGPQTLGGATCGLLLYVEEVDAVFQRAVAAGAKVHHPVKDQFYGDRSGTVIDPFGHQWTVATHVEDVSMEEMQRRMKAMAQAGG